jgi:predicted regulator of Ras-like GTPase activity (Roadblock/LC7/MglB family)
VRKLKLGAGLGRATLFAMTELDEILAHLVDNVDGTVVAAVGGMDGLLVEQYPQNGHDLSATTAELTNVLNSSRTVFMQSFEGGDLKEVIVTSENLVGYTRLLNEDFFCLLVLEALGNIGKARLYSDQAVKHILEVFA